MALSDLPSIPPSLEEQYSRLLVVKKIPGKDHRAIALNPAVRTAESRPRQNYQLRIATQAASWLTTQHANHLSSTARSQFYLDRRTEILSGTFPAEWWIEANLENNRTMRAVPSCTLADPQPAPPYYDPSRFTSDCSYGTRDSIYNTPAPPGTPSQPSPGWRGEVIDGRYRDLWMAQYARGFDWHAQLHRFSSDPLIIHSTGQITAQASHRGNRWWFTIVTYGLTYSTSINPFDMIAYAPRDAVYRYTLPPENASGWSHTADVSQILDLRTVSRWDPFNLRRKVNVVQACPPALGRYFSRNDWVEVRLNLETAVYRGRPSGG